MATRAEGRARGGRSRIAELRTLAGRTLAEARDDHVTTTAQALAYSIFLAIPSALLVVLGVFSLVASPSDVDSLIDRASTVIPPEAASLLRDSLQRSAQSHASGLAMTVIGLALALWTTTSAATTLMQGLTTAFDRDDERGFLRKRLLALVIVGCLVAATALVGLFLVLGPYVERWIGSSVGQPGLVSWVWWTAQWPVLVLALLAAFAVLLYLGPDVDQRGWRWVSPGAVVALLIWLLASAGFSLYVSQFGSYNKTWGSLAAVVIMLIWLWLTSVALLLGAEVNAEAQRLATERSGLPPSENGLRLAPQSETRASAA